MFFVSAVIALSYVRSARQLVFKTVQLIKVIGAISLLFYSVVVAADVLVVPGSGASEYIVGELAKAFNSHQHIHQVIVPPTTGTAGALRDVNNGRASLGRVGRPLKESECVPGLVYFPLARDPVVFVGGAGVTTGGVTTEMAVNVYAGAVTNWSELGGKVALIRAIGRESSDSSIQAIARHISAFENMNFADRVKVVHLDSQMIELLDRYPSSFGFLNRSALFAAKTKLVILSLNSVEPNYDNLKSGSYPLFTELGLVFKEGGLTDAGRSFIEFIKSPAGIRVLRMNGLDSSIQ